MTAGSTTVDAAIRAGATARVSPQNVRYPAALRDAERTLLDKRRAAAQVDGDVTGVALSGGGIRSATFCLGVFQALGRHGLVRRVDYLSTVSGGGYFGAFLGRLFGRTTANEVPYVAGPVDVEEVLAERKHPEVIRALRENGRYLSPNGAGDLLLGAAVLLRNWVSVQVVVLTAAVTLFLGAESALRALRVGCPRTIEDFELVLNSVLWTPSWIACECAPCRPGECATAAFRFDWNLWAAPFLAVVWGGAIPLGIAYWLDRASAAVWLVLGAAFGVGLAAGLGNVIESMNGLGALLGVPVMAVLWWRLAHHRSRHDEALAADAALRNRLSRWLKVALLWSAGLFALAVVDTIGHTLHDVLSTDRLRGLGSWLGAALVSLGTPIVFAQRIAVAFAGTADGKRLKLPLAVVVGVAAFVVVAVVAIAASTAAHYIAGGHAAPESEATRSPMDELLRALTGFSVAAALTAAFGRGWRFLTRSSHHPLYSSRLTRAYLGASNPLRLADGVPLTDVTEGDDVELAAYFASVSRGAPLHLMNVTVNETVDGRSNVQQQDRKGTGLAIGPCGLSLGVRHHALFAWDANVSVLVSEVTGYQVFADSPEPASRGWAPRWFEKPEDLSLGKWLAISGAAFSTGLGARTSLGLSVLAGLANVRLGYWWKPGLRRAETFVGRSLPVLAYLGREIVARFPGTARPRWYLSDGGHFENMGGYELLRRGVRRIVVVDAEADPAYTFEGLANLVRKARIDFGIEIVFLEEHQLDDSVDPRVRQSLGTLAQLRRLQAPDEVRSSLAHAALARIRYTDRAQDDGWLVYIKPTLTGAEPADLTEYHAKHPAFPQETTADQFFDEAQWESYRKLGDNIATLLFADRSDEQLPANASGGRFTPRGLLTSAPLPGS